jgi:hypothetical protein
MAELSDLGINPNPKNATLYVEDDMIWFDFGEDMQYVSMSLPQAKTLLVGLQRAIIGLEDMLNAKKGLLQ